MSETRPRESKCLTESEVITLLIEKTQHNYDKFIKLAEHFDKEKDYAIEDEDTTHSVRLFKKNP